MIHTKTLQADFTFKVNRLHQLEVLCKWVMKTN